MTMRIQPSLFLSTFTSVVIASCGSHAPSALSSPANPVVPQVLQSGNPPTQWVVIPTNFAPIGIAVGADKQIWVTGDDTHAVYRIEVTTGAISSPAPLGFEPGPLIEGPDGNVWTCGSRDGGGLAKVSTNLDVTDYPVPSGCRGITAGPDGAVWFTAPDNCAIERVTTDGSITEHVSPFCPLIPVDILTGSDGNIWFTEVALGHTHLPNGVVRYDTATSTFTEFQSVKPLTGLALGSDGNLYSCWAASTGDYGGQMEQITPAGEMHRFQLATRCAGTQPTANRSSIFYLTQGGNGGRWTVKGHHDVAFGQSPTRHGSTAMAYGPDDNIWNADASFTNSTVEVFVNRILSVAPSSATISIGQSQPFSVTETKCNCAWSAKSSNPSVATVSSVSGGNFTVTAVASGTATVTVADKKQNVFNVPITVH